jgi:hypothetical protein
LRRAILALSGYRVPMTFWWAREDSNLQPSGHEHPTLFGKADKNRHFRQRSATFVHPRLRRFIGYLLVERQCPLSGVKRTLG